MMKAISSTIQDVKSVVLLTLIVFMMMGITIAIAVILIPLALIVVPITLILDHRERRRNPRC
jgi:hypothetical protein